MKAGNPAAEVTGCFSNFSKSILFNFTGGKCVKLDKNVSSDRFEVSTIYFGEKNQ